MAWRFQYCYLSLALFPIGAMILAQRLLHYAEPGRLSPVTLTGLQPQTNFVAGHYLYLAALLALTILCIPAIYLAFRQIALRTCDWQRISLFVIVGIATLGLIYLFHHDFLHLCASSRLGDAAGGPPVFQAIGADLIEQTLGRVELTLSISICGLGQNEPLTAAQWLRLHVEIGNVLPLLAQCSLVIALCTVLAEPDLQAPSVEADRQALADGLNDQLRALNLILYAATALLIAGVITMHLWMRLPGLVLDDLAAKSYAQLAFSVLTFYAVGFSTILLSIYLPTALLLKRRATKLAGPVGQLSALSYPGVWLRQQGLTLDLRSQAGQVLAVIGPLIAGPLPVFLEALLSGTLG